LGFRVGYKKRQAKEGFSGLSDRKNSKGRENTWNWKTNKKIGGSGGKAGVCGTVRPANVWAPPGEMRKNPKRRMVLAGHIRVSLANKGGD